MQQETASIKRLSRLTAIVAALIILGSASSLWACGYGSQGGADYVPQERNQPQTQQNVKGQPISSDQAKDIANRYTKQVNPQLAVATPNDAGPYYEVDLTGKNGETVQVIGVDKFSGRIKVLN
jgi:Peptidase propeptide and YPEB domain